MLLIAFKYLPILPINIALVCYKNNFKITLHYKIVVVHIFRDRYFEIYLAVDSTIDNMVLLKK